MKIKTLLALATIIANSFVALFAQNASAKSDDFGRISFKTVIPEQVETVSPEVSNILLTKLNSIITQQGLGASGLNNRFILVANIVVLQRNVTTSTSTMYVLKIQLNLITGDGVEGLKFAQTSKELKGVGVTETKAYIDAISRLNTNDEAFKQMLNDSKEKILSYYSAKCEFILKNAQSLANQQKHNEALYELSLIPSVSSNCYASATDLAVKIFIQQQELQCKTKMNQAQNTWAANPNEEGAQKTAEILNEIDPSTTCFAGAKSLINKINASIKTKLSNIEAFDRKLTMTREKNEFELNKERIRAARDIAVSYNNSRPTTVVYSYRGWW